MVQTQNRSGDQHDPIVARATAPGAGAIAIVRVDGNGTGELLRRMFRPAGKRHPADSPREAIFGRWIHPGSEDVTLDEGLTIFFAAPHSFTGNDLAELQCHGGGAVVRSLIKAAMALGARPAEPGEFTRRAFLNGRLDLAEAEAVADLVRAETDAAARAAGAQLAGGLSRKIEALRRTLIDLTAEIEARIDFPEEGIEPADRRRLTGMFEQIGEGIESLAASRRRGRLLREGARVALIGAPNVGKSSLLNALARSDRAIVTPHPGTTRDTVECLIDLGGAAVTLIDTAGLREGAESIERIGIERTRRAIAGADYLIEVRDVTAPPGDSEFALADGREPDLIVLNKIDLLRGGGERGPMKEASADRSGAIEVSALTGEGIEELEAQMARLVLAEEEAGSRERDLGGVAIGERHGLALERARTALAEARGAWNEGAGGELVTIDLNEALNALNEILGLQPSEAVLDRIFERFCLGK